MPDTFQAAEKLPHNVVWSIRLKLSEKIKFIQGRSHRCHNDTRIYRISWSVSVENSVLVSFLNNSVLLSTSCVYWALFDHSSVLGKISLGETFPKTNQMHKEMCDVGQINLAVQFKRSTPSDPLLYTSVWHRLILPEKQARFMQIQEFVEMCSETDKKALILDRKRKPVRFLSCSSLHEPRLIKRATMQGRSQLEVLIQSRKSRATSTKIYRVQTDGTRAARAHNARVDNHCTRMECQVSRCLQDVAAHCAQPWKFQSAWAPVWFWIHKGKHKIASKSTRRRGLEFAVFLDKRRCATWPIFPYEKMTPRNSRQATRARVHAGIETHHKFRTLWCRLDSEAALQRMQLHLLRCAQQLQGSPRRPPFLYFWRATLEMFALPCFSLFCNETKSVWCLEETPVVSWMTRSIPACTYRKSQAVDSIQSHPKDSWHPDIVSISFVLSPRVSRALMPLFSCFVCFRPFDEPSKLRCLPPPLPSKMRSKNSSVDLDFVAKATCVKLANSSPFSWYLQMQSSNVGHKFVVPKRLKCEKRIYICVANLSNWQLLTAITAPQMGKLHLFESCVTKAQVWHIWQITPNNVQCSKYLDRFFSVKAKKNYNCECVQPTNGWRRTQTEKLIKWVQKFVDLKTAAVSCWWVAQNGTKASTEARFFLRARSYARVCDQAHTFRIFIRAQENQFWPFGARGGEYGTSNVCPILENTLRVGEGSISWNGHHQITCRHHWSKCSFSHFRNGNFLWLVLWKKMRVRDW